jgi:hypothetical protein
MTCPSTRDVEIERLRAEVARVLGQRDQLALKVFEVNKWKTEAEAEIEALKAAARAVVDSFRKDNVSRWCDDVGALAALVAK